MRNSLRLFIIIQVSFFIFSVCGISIAEDLPIKNIHGIRYYAPNAEKLQSPAPLFKLSYGPGKEQVGGINQDPEHLTDGLPTALRARKDGSIWILDSNNKALKLFSPKGKLIESTDLTSILIEPGLFVKDFAPAPSGGFYLLSPLDGMIKHIGPDGKLIQSIEGFFDALEINNSKSGSVLVRAPAMGALFKFSPEAVIEKQFKDPELYPFEDVQGRPYGLNGSDEKVLLYRCDTDDAKQKKVLQVFALGKVLEGVSPGQGFLHGVRFVGYRIIGTDAAGRIYVELVTANQDGIVFSHTINRILPKGTLDKIIQISPIPFLAPDLARHFSVTPDGRILGFYEEKGDYFLCSYTFP